ncbi:P-loop containing nucleoside triphosphate hydrolase protein [Chiua virens]|nr:P-loop containing nucleoside triphosphate hydrolase protein [Chiua virens]
MLLDKFLALITPEKNPSSTTSTSTNDVKSNYQELRLGVWRVQLMKNSHLFRLDFGWKDLTTALPFLRRALYDVYTISPRLFAFCIIEQLWSAIDRPLSLYLSNRLFYAIEARIAGAIVNNQSSSHLYLAGISSLAYSLVSAYIRRLSRKNRNSYTSRIKYEYESRVFSGEPKIFAFCEHSMLNLELSQASLGSANGASLDVDSVYQALEGGIGIITEAGSFILQLRLIANVIGTGYRGGGPVFLALCILPPFLKQFTSDALWSKAYVTSAVNPFYIRKAALGKLVETELKQEVMAGGVAGLLMNEYRKAKDGLGDTPDSMPELLYGQHRQVLMDIIEILASKGPLFYFVFLALFHPSRLSIVQLAVLNQTSTSLRRVFTDEERVTKPAQEWELKLEMCPSLIPTPTLNAQPSQMFRLPFNQGSSSSSSGANGSGKSTIIKLLSRFFDPNSGEILIDGMPIEEYSMDTLRKGIAMLTQEHRLFPLSVEENIKLGTSDVEAMKDQRKVESSVSAVGAEDLIGNFSEGYNTTLEPVSTGYLSYAGNGIKELEAIKKSLEKSTNISGGEKQKLVAARTFMRLFTSPVKLVTVDEPSSALDPEAEYRLFANLRAERKGRTMIFVTHRFGHLTKYADLIICMKEGAVVEIGSHADLLSKGGEYAHLYNIQAQAFATA